MKSIQTNQYKALPHSVTTYFPEFVGDLVLTLYIDKDLRTAYRGIYCVFHDKFSNRYFEVGTGNMALEGTGGGKMAAVDLFEALSQYKASGHKVAVIPRVIDNEVIDNFYLLNSTESYESLFYKSQDLYHYSSEPFNSINKTFKDLCIKYLQ